MYAQIVGTSIGVAEMAQTPYRKKGASLAAKNALRIRSAKNTSQLDLAIKAAEVEATVTRTVPLLFEQPFRKESRVFAYEDQSYLLLRMEKDGSYFPMVPATIADRYFARMITDQTMPAATEDQVASYQTSLTLEEVIQGRFRDARKKLREDPSEENHAALRRLNIVCSEERKLIRCYGHFIDSDHNGNCSFCGGRPGSAAVRYPDEQGTQSEQVKRKEKQ